ncbi:MAG: YjbH domain-containing protein [Syntrophobacterales bacterium]|nr:YjbH domain-containing protein [Syntrophobacterales bacterium]
MKVFGALLMLFIGAAAGFAADEPFTAPANWGGTGLMEIPSARVLRENSYRIGFSQVEPYRYYYGAISPLPGLEIDGRMTETMVSIDKPGTNWEGYGNYKDKAVDVKYQFVAEGKYSPALAVGIMDPHGTRLYASQYIVASKQLYPFDFTLGFGNGRFGKRPLPAQGEGIRVEMLQDRQGWLSDSQFFGGIQFAPSDRYAFMVEYSPIRYHEQAGDPALRGGYFSEAVPSPYNFGFRYNFYNWADLTLSWQRGNQWGVNVSMPFEIGKPMIPIYAPRYKEHPEIALMDVERRMLFGLGLSGFSSIGITLSGGDLTIDLENNRFFYNARGVQEALFTIAPMVREHNASGKNGRIDSILIIVKENGVPLYSYRTGAEDLLEYAAERLSDGEFHSLATIDTGYVALPEGRKELTPGYVIGYKPQVQLFLNDPSGFWKGKVGLSLWASYPVRAGGSLVAGAALYPFANVETVNEPLSIPVRTDIVNYLKNKALFERFLFNQVERIPGTSVYAKITAGILEMQYAGLDAEAALPTLGGRLLLGLGGSLVKKRDPDNPLKLAENTVKEYYKTAFFNTRLNFPQSDIALDVKYGMFLAGDKGAKITLSKFINGVTLSAWYSVTDTKIFADSDNRGYHDKGIAVSIPIRLFTGKESRAVYGQAISPWTRDVAQDIDHFTSLFDLIGRNTDVFLGKTLDKNKYH